MFVGVLRQKKEKQKRVSPSFASPKKKCVFLFDLKQKRSHILFAQKTRSWLNTRRRVQFVFFWFSSYRVFSFSGEKRHVLSLRKIQHGRGSFLGETEPFLFADHGILEVSYHLYALQWCM